MGRVRWSHVTIALALIAAVAIAAPALGGPSLKKLVKNEVAKQLAKATGPPGQAGANGLNGLNGTNGTNGTARAYARVLPHASMPCTGGPLTDECTFDRSKGVTKVVREDPGVYCVTAPGITPAGSAAAVTVDWASTAVPQGEASVTTFATGCGTGPSSFAVIVVRRPNITVDANGGTNNATVAGPAAEADNVGFTIVIP